MDVLLIHNHYQQPGGEDQAFDSEARSLALRGHRVLRHEVHNASIGFRPLKAALGTIWNRDAYREIRTLLRRERPQVLHAHNTFPLYSPSIYYAAKAEGVPVVQTLHNYRLLCPAATLCRAGEVCTKCVHKTIPWPAVQHGCYRDSRPGSAVVSAMLAVHRLMGTWHKLVDAYILPAEFGRQMFLNAGFPPEKLFVKPNFCDLPSAEEHGAERAGGLFVGRLSPEKGIEVMLDAWRAVDRSIPLRIVGDGPLREVVKRAATQMENVHFFGWLSKAEIAQQMRASAFLIVPSIWYEVFGINVIEAYSMGVPVIGSRIGGLAEIIRNGETGLLVSPHNAADLRAAVRWAVSHPLEMRQMGMRARAEFEHRYSEESAHQMLMRVYEAVLRRFSKSRLHVSSSAVTPGVRLVPEGRFGPPVTSRLL